jgi:hypothetical protein
MEKNNVYIWSGIVVFLVALVAFIVVNSQGELKKQIRCQSLRIRPLTANFFTWKGIMELNQKGEYQPKCI